MKMYYLKENSYEYLHENSIVKIRMVKGTKRSISLCNWKSVFRLALNSVSIRSLESVAHIISDCTVALGGS